MAYSSGDGRSVSSFTTGISKWTRKCQSRLEEVPKEVNWRISMKIIQRSPVDTGLFRGNWQASLKSKPRGVVGTLDPTGTITMGKVTNVLMRMRPGDRFFLSNNLPYARALEYGHSKQAPQGMVRLTIAEFHSITALAVADVKRKIP
jgi:hypothetical protein